MLFSGYTPYDSTLPLHVAPTSQVVNFISTVVFEYANAHTLLVHYNHESRATFSGDEFTIITEIVGGA